jgi:hypothetical protein
MEYKGKHRAEDRPDHRRMNHRHITNSNETPAQAKDRLDKIEPPYRARAKHPRTDMPPAGSPRGRGPSGVTRTRQLRQAYFRLVLVCEEAIVNPLTASTVPSKPSHRAA